MLRVARYTLAAALISLALARCQDVTGPNSAARPPRTGLVMSGVAESTAPLILHTVPPQTTDPEITWAPSANPQLADHYVWLNPSVRGNPKLLVFMPGTGNQPFQWSQYLLPVAAHLGYHVIGLMYQNDKGVDGICKGSPDPDCSGKMRLEILDGIDHSGLVNVTRANSIDNRLAKLLVYLSRDDQFADEGWSRFLDEDGMPKWSQIVVAGQSQGAGQAALIGKLRHVDRVVMFSGPPDARVPEVTDPWISIGATPAAKYFGLFHEQDQLVVGIRTNLAALDMERFGPPIVVEENEPPYGGAHILATNLLPQSGSYAPRAPHQSTARDDQTPLGGSDGKTPLLRDAWRYLLGAHHADQELADDREHRDEIDVGSGGGTRH